MKGRFPMNKNHAANTIPLSKRVTEAEKNKADDPPDVDMPPETEMSPPQFG